MRIAVLLVHGCQNYTTNLKRHMGELSSFGRSPDSLRDLSVMIENQLQLLKTQSMIEGGRRAVFEAHNAMRVSRCASFTRGGNAIGSRRRRDCKDEELGLFSCVSA